MKRLQIVNGCAFPIQISKSGIEFIKNASKSLNNGDLDFNKGANEAKGHA